MITSIIREICFILLLIRLFMRESEKVQKKYEHSIVPRIIDTGFFATFSAVNFIEGKIIWGTVFAVLLIAYLFSFWMRHKTKPKA